MISFMVSPSVLFVHVFIPAAAGAPPAAADNTISRGHAKCDRHAQLAFQQRATSAISKNDDTATLYNFVKYNKSVFANSGHL